MNGQNRLFSLRNMLPEPITANAKRIPYGDEPDSKETNVSQGQDHVANIIAGTLLGALIGGGLGLGACVYIFDEPPFFTGDTILIGAITCGTLGYVLGEAFIEWLKENWWWF